MPALVPARHEELPVYRPFALLAFGATLAAGTPLGIWMLLRLHGGGGQVPAEWILLHADLQIFGFFGTLIMGVAHHLVARFTGRPVAPSSLAPWLVGLMGAALPLRIVGTAASWSPLILVAAGLQATAFLSFGAWAWRALDLPHLAFLRRHLTVSTGWLTLALLVEMALRWPVQGGDGLVPDPRWMRAVHLAGIFGGVAGWMLGVALRAGPMFVPGWRVPEPVARAVPWTLAFGVLTATAGEVGPWAASTSAVLARLGEALALGTVGVVALVGGAARRAGGALPLLSRIGVEARFFRLALLAAGLAGLGAATGAGLAWRGAPLSLLADVLRHLVTVGFLTAMVLGMAFRLVAVFEGVALPWPRLRPVAFWALVGGLVLRTAELLADYGWEAILLWVPLSGVLVWVALACVSANLVGVIGARRAADAPRSRTV